MKLIDEKLFNELRRLEKEGLTQNKTATLGKIEVEEMKIIQDYKGEPVDVSIWQGFRIVKSENDTEFVCTGEVLSKEALKKEQFKAKIIAALEERAATDAIIAKSISTK